jgi:hypothetical protein
MKIKVQIELLLRLGKILFKSIPSNNQIIFTSLKEVQNHLSNAWITLYRVEIPKKISKGLSTNTLPVRILLFSINSFSHRKLIYKTIHLKSSNFFVKLARVQFKEQL